MPTVRMKDGVEIYYEEYGSGERYLLCTQVGHGPYSLEKELARRGFHVFLLTNRGFGKSTHVTEDYGDGWYDKFADDVAEFADQMGIRKFAYSGASHGAGSGWHVVLRHPERVTCFFAVVPGPHSLAEGTQSLRTMIQLGLAEPPIIRAQTDDPRLLERRKIEDELEAQRRAEPDHKEVYESPETMAIDYGRPLRALKTEEALQEALRTIQTPVLILGGMEDGISRPDLMVRAARCLSHCKLVIHAGVGHALDLWEDAASDALRFYENVEQTGYYYDPIVNE